MTGCLIREVKYEDDLIGSEGWGRRKKFFYGGNPDDQSQR